MPLITCGAFSSAGSGQIANKESRVKQEITKDHERGPPRRGSSLLYQPPMLPHVDLGRLVSADVVRQHLLAVGSLLWIALVVEPGALLHIAAQVLPEHPLQLGGSPYG